MSDDWKLRDYARLLRMTPDQRFEHLEAQPPGSAAKWDHEREYFYDWGTANPERNEYEAWSLGRIFGLGVALHRFVPLYNNEPFHTHQADFGIRYILSGGYTEEVWVPGGQPRRVSWKAGQIGIIRASYCHRIIETDGMKPSYTLWARGKTKHDVVERYLSGRVETVPAA